MSCYIKTGNWKTNDIQPCCWLLSVNTAKGPDKDIDTFIFSEAAQQQNHLVISSQAEPLAQGLLGDRRITQFFEYQLVAMRDSSNPQRIDVIKFDKSSSIDVFVGKYSVEAAVYVSINEPGRGTLPERSCSMTTEGEWCHIVAYVDQT